MGDEEIWRERREMVRVAERSPEFVLTSFDARSLPPDFPFSYARVRGDGVIEGSHDNATWQATTFAAGMNRR